MIVTVKKYLFFILMLGYGAMINANTPPQWQIDLSSSELKFTGTQNSAPVSGTFKTFSGEILADPVNYQQSTVKIIVDMNSISASYADLITILSSPDWFNVQKFPKAEFNATKYNKINDTTFEAIGNLTIRDKTAPVTLTFTAKETSKNQYVVEGGTTISRTAFGVGQGEWASTTEIKDEVVIHFKLIASHK